jgi:Arc/MetJ-type ribon-helix-helix transcriptional regulator
MRNRPRETAQERVTVSLTRGRLARVKGLVKAGRATSVSAYVDDALAEREERMQLETLLDDMDREFGRPTKEDAAWARRVLGL